MIYLFSAAVEVLEPPAGMNMAGCLLEALASWLGSDGWLVLLYREERRRHCWET